jgi:hypothetical protein
MSKDDFVFDDSLVISLHGDKIMSSFSPIAHELPPYYIDIFKVNRSITPSGRLYLAVSYQYQILAKGEFAVDPSSIAAVIECANALIAEVRASHPQLLGCDARILSSENEKLAQKLCDSLERKVATWAQRDLFKASPDWDYRACLDAVAHARTAIRKRDSIRLRAVLTKLGVLGTQSGVDEISVTARALSQIAEHVLPR